MLISIILRVKFLENAIDLVFTVCDLLVLDQHKFLESEQSFEHHAYILLHDRGQGWLVIHHECDDFDQSA